MPVSIFIPLPPWLAAFPGQEEPLGKVVSDDVRDGRDACPTLQAGGDVGGGRPTAANG